MLLWQERYVTWTEICFLLTFTDMLKSKQFAICKHFQLFYMILMFFLRTEPWYTSKDSSELLWFKQLLWFIFPTKLLFSVTHCDFLSFNHHDICEKAHILCVQWQIIWKIFIYMYLLRKLCIWMKCSMKLKPITDWQKGSLILNKTIKWNLFVIYLSFFKWAYAMPY